MTDLAKSRCVYRAFSGQINDAVYGVGHEIVDVYGRRWLDLSSGPGVSSLGHTNDYVKSEMIAQLTRIPYSFASVFATESSEKLAAMIIDELNSTWPGKYGKVLFACGGGEAVDIACKLAIQYWAEKDQARFMIMTRKYGFHGVGCFTGGQSDDFGRFTMMKPFNELMRVATNRKLPGYLGASSGFSTVSEYESALLGLTEDAILRNKKHLAAVMVEPVGGPPTGSAAPMPMYQEGLRKACDEAGTLLIADEVLCGAGRCGAFTASQRYQVAPDILVMGKSLTAGYAPLSAIVLSQEIVDTFAAGSNTIMAGTTYTAHSVSCAAGLATLRYMGVKGLYQKIRENEIRVADKIRVMLRDNPAFHTVRGLGYLIGVELRPQAEAFFPADYGFHGRVRKRAHEMGVVVYSKGQTVEGSRDYISLTLPYELTHDELHHGLEVLDKAIRIEYDAYMKTK